MDKVALDKWIERLPFDSDFDNYFEGVVCAFSAPFFFKNMEWIEESEICENLIDSCLNRDKSIIFAAKLIERLHRLYKI
jgi:hypothetical protein